MELVRFPSHGGFSVRRIITFALAVVITALFHVIFTSTPSYAAPSATWQGEDTLLFDNHGYVRAPDFKDATNTIPEGAVAYKSTVQPATEASPNQKLLVLYFAPGVDPPTGDTAQYVEFTYKDGEVSNPRNQQSVAVAAPDPSGNSGSSCSVEGIGWIVCPVSNFLADAMDNIFNMLATFIAVKPMVLGDTSNSMYVAWNIMRTIANIAFVIAFLIIIYSQVTSIGISNYGLKKLIPRLIVAAVLVNLSYYITALALDISNVLGYSVQNFFNIIREQTFHLTNDNLSGINTASGGWATVTAVALGTGGLIGGVWYLASGAIYLLIPVLLGLIFTAILVLVILAARQAIIVILVIIAPLAFVANLLPNTEKLFEKWKDLFMTMLIFFPAFSLVFGGSQLAGQIIIQNAGDNIIMLIFGMAVQIAPLVITPLILKLSGSLLGRIAQIANNPQKGVLDRSRNWANKRAELRKNNTLGGFKPLKKLEGNRRTKFRNGLSNAANIGNRIVTAPGRPFVRGADNMSRNLDAQLEASKLEATNRYEDKNKKYAKIHERKEAAGYTQKAVHAHHSTHIERLRTTAGTPIHAASLRAEEAGDGLKTAQENATTYYNRMRATGGTALNRHAVQLATSQSFNKSAEVDTAAYLNRMRATNGTPLNRATDQLLHSEHQGERWNQEYEAYKNKVILNNKKVQIPGSGSLSVGIGDAARLAVSSKEHAETAQTRVQAMFDRERANPGTILNASSIILEDAKIQAEGAKAKLATYVADQKTTSGTTIHANMLTTERLKQGQQIADTRLSRTIEEYKSGAINPTTLTAREQVIMEQMAQNTESLAAEAQGTQAARNTQTKRIAEAFTETFIDPTGKKVPTARAAELRNIAKSVDEYGDVRAEATALATLDDIVGKARTANESLLETRAVGAHMHSKDYALDLLRKRLGGDTSESEDIIRAAIEIAGKEAQIPIIREMRMSGNFNQDHLTAMLLRNSGTMKAKGGFDLQANPGLIGASSQVMNASIAGTLGSTSAESLKDLKFGEIDTRAAEMPTIIADTQAMAGSSDPTEQKYGINGILGLNKTYQNLAIALNDPQIVRSLGDNLIPALKMHATIHNNPAFHNDDLEVNYRTADPQNLAGLY